MEMEIFRKSRESTSAHAHKYTHAHTNLHGIAHKNQWINQSELVKKTKMA